MSRRFMLAVVVVFASAGVSQAQVFKHGLGLGHLGHHHHGHHHHVVGVYGGFGYPVYDGFGVGIGAPVGATAASSYLFGQAAYVQSLGQYNLLTAQAAKAQQEATSQAIVNNRKAVESFFAKRELNAAFKAQSQPMRTPLTSEQIQASNAARKPQPLSEIELNPATGEIAWPAALQGGEFARMRTEVQRQFAERAAQAGSPASFDAAALNATVGQFRDQLKGHVGAMRPADYLAARKFIDRLDVEADLAMPAAGLAAR